MPDHHDPGVVAERVVFLIVTVLTLIALVCIYRGG